MLNLMWKKNHHNKKANVCLHESIFLVILPNPNQKQKNKKEKVKKRRRNFYHKYNIKTKSGNKKLQINKNNKIN